MAGSEASGLLMSVIRTLHETDTGQEREEEKRKLETEFKQCDTRLDRMVAEHQGELSAVMLTYSTVREVEVERKGFNCLVNRVHGIDFTTFNRPVSYSLDIICSNMAMTHPFRAPRSRAACTRPGTV